MNTKFNIGDKVVAKGFKQFIVYHISIYVDEKVVYKGSDQSFSFVENELTLAQEVTYRVGNIFKCGGMYMLSQVAPSRVALIGLRGGNRLVESILVKDSMKVTESEFAKIRNDTSSGEIEYAYSGVAEMYAK